MVLTAAPADAHNCTCRHAGQSYQLGQVVCIRGKLAQCVMVLNNSSWNMLSETCPEASARPYTVSWGAQAHAPAVWRFSAPSCS